MCYGCDECQKVQTLTRRGVGDAAAGLGLHFLHMSEGPFSHDAGHMYYFPMKNTCSFPLFFTRNYFIEKVNWKFIVFCCFSSRSPVALETQVTWYCSMLTVSPASDVRRDPRLLAVHTGRGTFVGYYLHSHGTPCFSSRHIKSSVFRATLLIKTARP